MWKKVIRRFQAHCIASSNRVSGCDICWWLYPSKRRNLDALETCTHGKNITSVLHKVEDSEMVSLVLQSLYHLRIENPVNAPKMLCTNTTLMMITWWSIRNLPSFPSHSWDRKKTTINAFRCRCFLAFVPDYRIIIRLVVVITEREGRLGVALNKNNVISSCSDLLFLKRIPFQAGSRGND